jgi:hypothetical protein
MSYQRDDVKAPRVSGFALKAFVRLLESPVAGVVIDKLVRDSGIERWRKTAVDAPPLQFRSLGLSLLQLMLIVVAKPAAARLPATSDGPRLAAVD